MPAVPPRAIVPYAPTFAKATAGEPASAEPMAGRPAAVPQPSAPTFAKATAGEPVPPPFGAVAESEPAKPATEPKPPSAPASPAKPTFAKATAGEPVVVGEPLAVPLKALAESWPETLRQEIVQSKLLDSRLMLPCAAIADALKAGRAAFPWKTLRAWLQPAPLETESPNDATELELPLKVVTPLFFARKNGTLTKPTHRVTIDEGIPNLFFGFPTGEAPPASVATPSVTPAGTPKAFGAAAVTKPVDTNYYIWDDNSDTAIIQESEYKRKTPGGTDFVARYATPNEIVSRAAALDGVAGALIALPDGLMVASRIPAELNGDTLAAFLPQIFAKVNQCTRELRMGELNNLNFTVGNVPWKIFRVNAIFFAAFGRVAEPLPTAELAALAAELDRKQK
jgi:predicted regulator of Ras-like GTPase activity (Roadblock/LC7/MglB family)